MNEDRNWTPAPGSSWEKITPEQHKDLLRLRDRMRRHILTELEAFYVYHPEIVLSFHIECQAEVNGITLGDIYEEK